jgi:hypothetical protein
MPLRAPIAVVNERSLPPASGPLELSYAVDVLGAFVDLLRSLHTIRPDLALAAAAPLGAVPLTTEGLSFAAISELEGGITKERWRYIQGRRNIAPFSSSIDVQIPGLDEEFRIEGESCLGLGVAVSSGQLAVSFQTDKRWDVERIQLIRYRLLEDDLSGDVVEDTCQLEVVHACRPSHAEVHSQFVGDLALPDPFSGADLWADRENRYPSLQFLPCVEDQLRSLGPGGAVVSQVHDRLCELNAAATEWDPACSPFPAWRSNVTPEGEQRKKLCMFTDDDGETRCFDLHARFTPGAGRIHFRLVPDSRALRVAHVGAKLGA